MLKISLIATVTMLLAPAFASPAQASPRDFLICIPGSPGSSAAAQSYMAPFFRRLESLAGWPATSINGTYLPTYSGCISKIQSSQPGFAVMALGAYLEKKKSYPMKIIGNVNMFAGAGKRLYLVVKQGKYKTVADLKGKKLTSNHLAEKKFLSQVLFGGKIDVSRHFLLRQVNLTTKGMRDVARGRADATIVNDDELRTMKRRSWGKQLVVIEKSPPLPGSPLVAFTKWASSGDVSKLRSIVGKICKGADGSKLCTSAGISGIQPASRSTFARIIQIYGR